jgi:hypothetical protein
VFGSIAVNMNASSLDQSSDIHADRAFAVNKVPHQFHHRSHFTDNSMSKCQSQLWPAARTSVNCAGNVKQWHGTTFILMQNLL